MGAAASVVVQKAPSRIDESTMRELAGEELFDQQSFDVACDEEGFITREILRDYVIQLKAQEAAQKRAEGDVEEDDGGLSVFMEEVETGRVLLIRANWLIQLYDKGVAADEAAVASQDLTETPAKTKIPARFELPNVAELRQAVEEAKQRVQKEVERIDPLLRESRNAELKFSLKQDLRAIEADLALAEKELARSYAIYGTSEDLEKENCCIAVVSAPWITPEHPDPDGFHLSKVVPVLRWYLKIHEEADLFVFWDWMSLCQHGYRYIRASITKVVEGPPENPGGRPTIAYDIEFDAKEEDTPGIIRNCIQPKFFSSRLGENKVDETEIKIGTRSARVASRMTRVEDHEALYLAALKKIETWFYSPLTLKIIQDVYPLDAPIGMKKFKERAWCQFELQAACCFTPPELVISCQQLATTINFFEPTKKWFYNVKNRQLPTIDEFMKLNASENLDGFMAYLDKCEGVKPTTWTEFMSMRPGENNNGKQPKMLQFSPLRKNPPPTPNEFGTMLMDLAVAERSDRKLIDTKWAAIYKMAYSQKDMLLCDELGWAFRLDKLALYDCQFTLEVIDFSGNPDMTGSLELFYYLKVLKELTLVGCCSITGSLKPLRKLLGLEHLNLQGCTSLEGTLEHLSGLTDLLDLNLSVDDSISFDDPTLQKRSKGSFDSDSGTEQTGDTDKEKNTMGFTGTLIPLSGCTRLRYLNLRGCTKLQGVLEPLHECPTLRSGETHRAYINLTYCMGLDGNMELDNGLQVVPAVAYGDPDVIFKEPERRLTDEEIDRLERGLKLLVPLEDTQEAADIEKAPALGNCKPLWGKDGRPASPSPAEKRATMAAAAAAAVAAVEAQAGGPLDAYEAAKAKNQQMEEEKRKKKQIEDENFIPESDAESHDYSTDHEIGSLGDPTEGLEPSQQQYLPPAYTASGVSEPYYLQAPDPSEFEEFQRKMKEKEFEKAKDDAIAQAQVESG